MTDFVDVFKNTPLAKGGHDAGSGKACLMEKVSILWALNTGQDVRDVFSDLPPCTNAFIARNAQAVNDISSEAERQKLNAMIPRLLRARRTDSDHRINTRLALWAAKRVLHLVEPRDLEKATEAIAAAEAWLENPCQETEDRAAATAAAATTAATATAATAYAATAYAYAAATAAATATAATAYAATAYAYAYAAAATAAAATTATAATAYAYAYATAATAYAATAYAATAYAYAAATAAATEKKRDLDLAVFLDELLDQWEEAASKEGEDIYVVQEWEDDVLELLGACGA